MRTDPRPVPRGFEVDAMRASLEQRLFSRFSTPVDVGRFVLIERAGLGAMGVVYRAYDPKLQREVALKLVRSELGGPDGQRSISRLLREARAAARISHPHVVTVYEVAEVDGGLCIAMEYVQGVTLRHWCRQRRRTWTEVLDVFIAAGRGLEAAHRVGVVHRDFKPENVLIDEYGRPRVADFGLARVSKDGQVTDRVSNRRPRAETTSVSTDDGTTVGTLAYMSPEQHEGAEVGPASDQFSFCVALWEALWNERPYPQVGAEALREAVAAPRRERPGSLGKTPRGLLSVVERGLEPDPRRRFASMEALLEELEVFRASPRRARRRRAIAGGVILATCVAAWSLGSTQSGEPPCAAAPELVADAWNETRRHAIERRFDDTGVLFAPRSAARVLEILDDYAARWEAMHTEACRATWVRGEQSESLLDRRMVCLRRSLAALDAYAVQLEQADPELVHDAVAGAEGLPMLRHCADVERLQTTIPSFADPVRSLVEEARDVLARARALELAGRHRQALEVAEHAVEAADRSGYASARAEAHNAVGRLRASIGRDGAEEARERAFAEALRGADDAQAVTAAVAMILLLDQDEARRGRARRWNERAEALIQRMGGDRLLEARRLEAMGQVMLAGGEVTTAIASFHQALELASGSEMPALQQATITMHLAKAQVEAAAYADAERALNEVLTILRRELGVDHPRLAEAYGALGALAGRKGEYEAAYLWFVRARDLLDASLGEHVITAGAHGNVGSAARLTGRPDEARAEMELALGMFERTLGEDSRQVAALMANLGNLAASEGQADAAIGYYRRALGHSANPHRDHALEGLAVVYQQRGEYDRALALLGEAKQARERSGRVDLAIQSQMHIASVLLDANRLQESIDAHRLALSTMVDAGLHAHIHRADAHFGIGEALVRLARYPEAIDALQESLRARAEEATPPPREVAKAELRLAQALHATKREPRSAAALARRAADVLADDPNLDPSDRELMQRLATLEE